MSQDPDADNVFGWSEHQNGSKGNSHNNSDYDDSGDDFADFADFGSFDKGHNTSSDDPFADTGSNNTSSNNNSDPFADNPSSEIDFGKTTRFDGF